MPVMAPRPRISLSGLLAAVFLVLLSTGALAAPRFPKGDEAYHTYPELSDELQAIAYNHPNLVRLSSIGKSYEGRDLWIVKISDNPGQDEAEPEVLFTGLTHARDPLTVEQSLAIIHWLTDDYDSNQRIRDIVNSTEIWVVPMLNPDGGQWDIRYGSYHMWRKNRQPTPGSEAIGTDINRNYGYHWGCCGGSSSNPYSIIYRGPRPWSTPEAFAERHFIAGRVIGGLQQISISISFHSYGAQILFPFGYTMQKLPPDMDPNDRKALYALAHGIGDRNGYTPMQGSHLYITDGGRNDWAYGRQHILGMTIELAPSTSGDGGFYPSGDRIPALTDNNRDAMLWFMEQAPCPYDAAGLTNDCPGAAMLPASFATLAPSDVVTGRPLAD